MTPLQISQIEHALGRLQKISTLNFLPEVRKDLKARYKETSVNDVVAQSLGISKQHVNYSPDWDRVTLNLDGVRLVLQGVNNTNQMEQQKIMKVFENTHFDIVMLSL